MKHTIFTICLGLLFSLGSTDAVKGQNPFFKVESNYLSKHDIIYQSPAYEGFEGFPLGNGDLGGMIWNTHNGIEVQINKNDLFDQSHEESRATLRGGVRLSIDLGSPGFEWIYLDDFEGRLSIQDAVVTLNSKTPFVENNISSWVAPEQNVWAFQIKSKNLDILQDGSKIRVSLERWGSRAFPGWYGYFSKDTKSGLGDTKALINGKDIVLEETFQGLHFAVACRVLGTETAPDILSKNRIELETADRNSERDLTIIVSMVTSNESQNPTKSAIELLDDFESKTIQQQREFHLQWWRKFWAQSFVHLEDDYIENIYYLRRYLMASSSRGKFPVVFNGGLWTWNHDVRNWVTPHHWNTQQQYWGLCPQNDCELMLPYLNTYFELMAKGEEHARLRGVNDAILWSEAHDFFGSMTFWDRGDMLNNFTPASQIAGLFWEYYEFTGDKDFLTEKAYPFMKKAAEFYLQKLEWDSLKNEYFIFPSQPYENPRSNNLLNPITDRNVIISNFSNCIKAAELLDVDRLKIDEWQNILDKLWPIPYQTIPEIGEVIAHAWDHEGSIFPRIEDRGPWLSHMSASTSAVFPANLVGLDRVDARQHNAMENMIKLRSTQTNAISPEPIVAARLGMGNQVLSMMHNGIRRLQHFPQGLFYNIDHWYNLSIYMDSLSKPDITAQRDYIYDERAQYPNKLPAKPFIQAGLETHSIYGAAINEMLLQSHEGKIRVFPAVPDNWATSFTLLARGSFVVSSQIDKNGAIPGVFILSQKGNVCQIVNPWSDSEVTVWSMNDDKWRKINFAINAKRVLEFKTSSGQTYMIVPQGTDNIFKKSHLEGSPTQSPKKFYEAILGKERNF